MEQMPEMEGFYKEKKHLNKKGIGKEHILDLGLRKMDSLPGVYLMSSDSSVSPYSGAKNSISQKRDGKWSMETTELKERFSYNHPQSKLNNPTRADKFIKKTSAMDAAQLKNVSDFDMFPPLGTQIKMFKPREALVNSDSCTPQLEARKVIFNEVHMENSGKNPSQLEDKRSFKALQLENKSEWKPPNFSNIRKEKAIYPQDNDRKGTIDSHHEYNESSLQFESDTHDKRTNKYVKKSSLGALVGELSLSIALKTNSHESDEKLTADEGIKNQSSNDESSSDYLSSNDKPSTKERSNQNSHLSIQNYANANRIGRDAYGNSSLFGRTLKKSSSSQHPCNLPEFCLGKVDIAGSSESTAPPDSFAEKVSSFSSKNNIISYLKMLLESQELQSPYYSTESKCLHSSESPTTDHDIEYECETFRNERKQMTEHDTVCEEMLNNYLVFSNLPHGVTREEILYHVSKVGIVSYCVMERNKAHTIFFKAEDAKTAFGLRHILYGRELVVSRPKRTSCTLYLSGLTSNTPNEQVIQMVSTYGVIVGFYRPLHKLTGGPMGYCFIKVDKQVAEDILKQSSLVVNNVNVYAEISSQSEVKFSSKTHSNNQLPFHASGNFGEYKVMFTNVPKLASYDLIKEHFQEFGRLQKVYVKNRKGFVIFASRDSLEQALSSRHTILGTEVKLSLDSLIP